MQDSGVMQGGKKDVGRSFGPSTPVTDLEIGIQLSAQYLILTSTGWGFIPKQIRFGGNWEYSSLRGGRNPGGSLGVEEVKTYHLSRVRI